MYVVRTRQTATLWIDSLMHSEDADFCGIARANLLCRSRKFSNGSAK